LSTFTGRRSTLLQRVLLLCLLLLQQTSMPRFAYTQPGPAGLTLKAELDQIQSALDATINNARNAGLELELVLGAQVAAEISLARQQFSTELNLQRAQWSATAAQLVDNLSQSITEISNHALAQAQDLVNQGQLIALSLPLADSTPRIRAFSPIINFQPPPGVNDLVFSVAGVFPDFGRDPKYNPMLVLDVKDGKGNPLPPFPATSGTALSAVFHVPSQQLVFPNSALQTIQAHVNVTYRKRCALVFHCDGHASYPELIGLLPQSPGNLHLSFSVTTEVYVTRLSTSYVLHQDGGGGDDLDHRQSVTPDPGYEVIPDSVQIKVLASGGDWGLNGNCSTTTAACWRVKTVQHHCVWFACPSGHDGSVNFQLSFAERILTTQTQNGAMTVPIGWDQTSLYTFPTDGALTWTAAYTDFNNHVVNFGSNNTTVASPYLKATNLSGTTYGFTVYPFNTDASSELSIAIPTGVYAANSPLNVQLTTDPTKNLNPLTPRGISALKAYATKALSISMPPPPGGAPAVNLSNSLVNRFSQLTASVVRVGPPTPNTPDAVRAKALDALAAAADDPTKGFK
jgi:hypothetical protein